MRRLVSFLILIAALLMLVGCGQKASPAGFTREDLYLNIGGAQYGLNTDIEMVIAVLGPDYAYSEAQSCDYEGLDKTYRYDTAEFYTWPMSEGDLVNEIYTEDPAVSASKGIAVGATREAVLAAYGEDGEDTGFQLIYRLPDSRESLCFDLEDGVVKAIYLTMQPF